MAVFGSAAIALMVIWSIEHTGVELAVVAIVAGLCAYFNPRRAEKRE